MRTLVLRRCAAGPYVSSLLWSAGRNTFRFQNVRFPRRSVLGQQRQSFPGSPSFRLCRSAGYPPHHLIYISLAVIFAFINRRYSLEHIPYIYHSFAKVWFWHMNTASSQALWRFDDQTYACAPLQHKHPIILLFMFYKEFSFYHITFNF